MKGYFVLGKSDTRLKVLLIFNKLSSYKKIIYKFFVETLGTPVIMPYFLPHTKKKEYLDMLKMVAPSKLMPLDRYLDELPLVKRAISSGF